MVGAHLVRPLTSLSDMSCLPEDSIASASVLLFDLEGAACDTAVNHLPFDQTAASAARTIDQINWLMSPANEEQRMLRNISRIVIDQGGDAAALATTLQRVNLSARLETVRGNKLHSLRHTFVVVAAADPSATGSLGSYIVDPSFRDAFAIAHPTPRYAAIVASLPQEAVAAPAILARVVSILAREMAKSFADNGSDLPPWRTTNAMLARWQLPAAPCVGLAGLKVPTFGGGQGGTAQLTLPTADKAVAAATGLMPMEL